jgi:nucleotidyltransferase/DNA polymerase involved in DNA repair
MSKEKTSDTMILHIDADAFFVSCEIARMPHLRGKAVIVGAERGSACAMSYEAKALGITRGMPVFQIKKLFPETVILPAHFELYHAYQKNLVAKLAELFSHIEVYSIDECFLEVSASELPFSDSALCKLRDDIQDTLGITYSLGLARTKTLAKIASKKNKPCGAYYLRKENELEMIGNMPVESVWGIGRRMAKTLNSHGVRTIAELIQCDDHFLHKHFSVQLLRTRDELCGIRRIPLCEIIDDQKSMQVTRSFMRTSDMTFVLSELSLNIEELSKRLTESGLVTNSITVWLKEMKGDKEIYHQLTVDLQEYTSESLQILKGAETFLIMMRSSRLLFRTTGVHAHNLRKKEAIPETLFNILDLNESNTSRKSELEELKVAIGNKHIHVASSLSAWNKRKEAVIKANKESFYTALLPYPYLGEAV